MTKREGANTPVKIPTAKPKFAPYLQGNPDVLKDLSSGFVFGPHIVITVTWPRSNHVA